MNTIICAFGGRKFFYAFYWGMIATGLLVFEHISSVEWMLVIGYTFGGSAIANATEAVMDIKAKSRVQVAEVESSPKIESVADADQSEREKIIRYLVDREVIEPNEAIGYTLSHLRALRQAN